MKFSYFPGCTLHSTALEYDQSTRAVCQALDIELVELPDWSCCGATSAHSINYLLSIALPTRNLAIAEKQGLDMILPCAACFNRHKIANRVLSENLEKREEIEKIVEFKYSGKLKVRHLLDVILNIVGLEKVKAKVVKPLSELKIVCYYGCLLVRPADITQFDNPEHPEVLDKLTRAIGAQVLNWSYKTECCGAFLSLTRDDIVSSLVGSLVNMAEEAGAQGIVTACPLCQANLEMRQNKGFPIFFFTELLGLAFGIVGSKDWLDKHLISPRKLTLV